MYLYDNYSDIQLLKLVIAEKPNETAVNNLIEKFPIQELFTDVGETELLSIEGLTPKKAKKILAINELIKRLYSRKYTEQMYTIKDPTDAVNLVMPEMRFLKNEQLKVLLLNIKNRVLGVETVSIGSLNSSIVSPPIILKTAIKKSAATFIIIHNHPSGDPSPSLEDINITHRLKDAGKLIGIELLDHLIIGDGNFVSLKEKGII